MSVPRQPLNILEVSTSGTIGSADMGPVSSTLCALANGFARLGQRSTVVDSLSTHSHRLGPGVDIERIGPSPQWLQRAKRMPAKIRLLYSWLWTWAYVRALRRRLRLEDFDVVHVHDPRVAFLLARKRVRFHYTSHTSVWALELEQGKRLRLGQKLEKATETYAIRRSVGTIALSDYLTRFVPDAAISVIPHAIDATRWTPLDRVTCRAELGIAKDTFIALFVGRIHTQKGVDILVQAIRKLAPHLPHLQAIVIGPPGGEFHRRTQPSRYAQRVLDSATGLPIRFMGFIGNESPQFRQWLSAADVAVFPSRHEPFGYVALEALAMSLPVIAARTGGLAATVTDEVGYLVPPEDTQALADAIRQAHDHPEQLAKRRAQCRPRVLSEYAPELFMRRHVDFFERNSAARPREAQ